MLKKLLKFNASHKIMLDRIGMLIQQIQQNKNLKLNKIKETIQIRMIPIGPQQIKLVIKATKQEAQDILLGQQMNKNNSNNQLKKKITVPKTPKPQKNEKLINSVILSIYDILKCFK